MRAIRSAFAFIGSSSTICMTSTGSRSLGRSLTARIPRRKQFALGTDEHLDEPLDLLRSCVAPAVGRTRLMNPPRRFRDGAACSLLVRGWGPLFARPGRTSEVSTPAMDRGPRIAEPVREVGDCLTVRQSGLLSRAPGSVLKRLPDCVPPEGVVRLEAFAPIVEQVVSGMIDAMQAPNRAPSLHVARRFH